MTISKADRTENLELALRLMLENIPADRPFEWEEFDGDLEPFTTILPTTWVALSRRGLVNARSFNRYQLTPDGWIAALRAAGHFRGPQMLENAGRLSAALKGTSRGDTKWGGTTRQELATDSGLDEAFVYNAIDSHLLRELFGTVDAFWAPEDQMKNYIDIPLDFGHDI
jgi:hypothetical protein